MGQPGMGVMIQQLSGNEASVKAFKQAIGQTIAGIDINDDELTFAFENGYILIMYDGGQSCCEHRYMVCYDDTDYYVGAKFFDAEIKDAPNENGPEDYEDHEVQFLEIVTSLGSFTIANHNEHNGYYGGFSIICR